MIVRLSPGYELVPFDRLSVREQALVAQLGREPDVFGVLRPRPGSHGTIKSISRSTALLLYTLQTPGPVPTLAVAAGDTSVNEVVRRLTLDGVIEVERDGQFISGAAAASAEPSAPGQPTTSVALVSHAALRAVIRLGDLSAGALADRLYVFNRRPLTPTWVSRVPTGGAVLRFVNAEPGSPTGALLDKLWKRKEDLDDSYWISWWPRDLGRHHRRGAEGTVTHKVYVSPRTETLPEAFPKIIEALAEAGAPSFKLGASASAILRPDKIVAYFASRRAAEETARMIAEALAGVPAHPVPFTHQIGDGGLTSLGMDPPVRRGMLSPTGSSWRLWVCRRLGSYVNTARHTGGAGGADRFALERISLDGVDPLTWEPTERALRGYLAEQQGTSS